MPSDQASRAVAGTRPCGLIVDILVGAVGAPGGGTYRLSPDVVVLVVDDGTARIVDLGGQHWAVSDTAAAMVLGTLGDGVERTCESIAAAAGVPVERVRGDALALLDDLCAAGAIVVGGGEPDRPSRWDRMAEAAGRATLRWCVARDRQTALTAWRLMALAWSATHTLGWASTVRWWQEEVEAASSCGGRPAPLEEITEVTSSVLARLPLPVACKERALCAYTLTRRAGLPAQIMLGVSLFPFTIHVWCESAGNVVGDRFEDGCDHFAPMMIYDGTSTPRPALDPADR